MFGLHVWILKKRENATPVSGPFGSLCYFIKQAKQVWQEQT